MSKLESLYRWIEDNPINIDIDGPDKKAAQPYMVTLGEFLFAAGEKVNISAFNQAYLKDIVEVLRELANDMEKFIEK